MAAFSPPSSWREQRPAMPAPPGNVARLGNGFKCSWGKGLSHARTCRAGGNEHCFHGETGSIGPHPWVPPRGWSTTQPERFALADSMFPSVQELPSSLCFHPPSAPASRLHPDRRRKVSGPVRCLPCPAASSLSLWPARPGLGRALFTLAQKGISLPCPGSSCWPVRKWGHCTPRSAAWDWNPGAKTRHRAPLIAPSP